MRERMRESEDEGVVGGSYPRGQGTAAAGIPSRDRRRARGHAAACSKKTKKLLQKTPWAFGKTTRGTDRHSKALKFS
jgi:hypothetical protein